MDKRHCKLTYGSRSTHEGYIILFQEGDKCHGFIIFVEATAARTMIEWVALGKLPKWIQSI